MRTDQRLQKAVARECQQENSLRREEGTGSRVEQDKAGQNREKRREEKRGNEEQSGTRERELKNARACGCSFMSMKSRVTLDKEE